MSATTHGVTGVLGRAVRLLTRSTVRWVRSAPGTYVWFAVLCATTLVYLQLPDDVREEFLRRRSTNLAQLQHDPIRVLVTSALWTNTPQLLGYLVTFTVISAPVERWLGTRRWLGVVVLGHVGATYLSQGLVLVGIDAGILPRHLRHVVDVGVSYGQHAVAGVALYAIARPWRWAWLAGTLVWVTVPILEQVSFTAVGHASALLIGFGCRWLTRGRPTWDPAVAVRRGWSAVRRRVAAV